MSNDEQYLNQIKGLNAQLDATKQMLNESLGHQVQLRATVIIFQGQINESLKEIANIKKEKDDIIKDKESLLARITELDAKITLLTPEVNSEVTLDAPNQVSE